MASKGTPKFIVQRCSAVMLLPLTVWFLISLIGNAGAGYLDMRAWLSAPLNAIIMFLLIIIGTVHMRIGMSEIIEDYIGRDIRPILMLLNTAFAVLIAIISAWSVLTLAFL